MTGTAVDLVWLAPALALLGFVLNGTLALARPNSKTLVSVIGAGVLLAAFAVSVPFDALAYPLSRGLYATHDTIRQVAASFAGFGVVLASSAALAAPLGLLAIPLGYAIGVALKDVLLGLFLVRRMRATM